MVWCAVSNHEILEYFFGKISVNGELYGRLLRDYLNPKLRNHPESTKSQHNGVPLHYGCSVRENLNRKLSPCRMSRRGAISCPARSPDLKHCDFFMGNIYKIYHTYSLPVQKENLNKKCNPSRSVT